MVGRYIASLSKVEVSLLQRVLRGPNGLIRAAALTFATVSLAVLGGCATAEHRCQFLSCADDGAWRVEVVPASWIALDGDSESSALPPVQADQSSPALAYAFPSVPPSLHSVVAPPPRGGAADSPPFDDLLGPHNSLNEGPFKWSPSHESSAPIQIDVQPLDPTADHHSRAKVTVSEADLLRIRRLDWEHFKRLRLAFAEYLYTHDDCYFKSCDAGWVAKFKKQMAFFWTSWGIGPTADWKVFAHEYFKSEVFQPIEYDGAVAELVRNKVGTRMFATRLRAGDVLDISWAVNSVAPPDYNNQWNNAYGRMVSAGSTTLTIQPSAEGEQLLPSGACSAIEVAQESTKLDSSLAYIPYRKEWNNFISGPKRLFMPIYNEFDLSNPQLLAHWIPTFDPCRRGRNYAPVVYLLAPSHYVKPDFGSSTPHQYDSELRIDNPVEGDPAKRDPPELRLARQFVLVGCNEENQDAVVHAWSRLLDQAYTTTSTDPKQPASVADADYKDDTPCATYTIGVFASKAFVTVHRRLFVNGKVVRGGVPLGSTLGQALETAIWQSADEGAARMAAGPVELLRAQSGDVPVSRIRARFLAPTAPVLDLVPVRQGDEIYAGLSAAVR